MSEPFVPLDFPSWIEWGQRAGANVPQRPRGPNGKRLCGWCDTECSGRRTRWCSDECSAKYGRVWSWGAVSRYVRKRDRETCQRCGTTDPPRPKQKGWGARVTPWDVDHVVPVVDGGTDDPANLRLLCIDCHRIVGYEQRAARRESEQGALDLEGAA